jgi:hypothetical protein
MRGTTLCCLTAALLLLSGCSQAEPTVTGVVRVGGEPLEKGSISFDPVDEKGAIAGDRGPGGGSPIVEGRYQIDKDLTVGKYRVKIQGTRKGPGKMRDSFGGIVDKEENVVPKKYYENSILIKEVRAGSNTINFEDLEGIKKGQ